MLIAFTCLHLLVSSPYPFEVKSGFVFEPTLGGLIQDNLDKNKVVGGIRLSYIHPDQTDAVITAEIQAISATSFEKPESKVITNTDYFFETSFVFYEIFNPVAFRLALGGGVEIRKSNTSPDLYYRGGLGRYFTSSFGIFLEAAGRIIFRDNKIGFPIELGPAFQFIF